MNDEELIQQLRLADCASNKLIPEGADELARKALSQVRKRSMRRRGWVAVAGLVMAGGGTWALYSVTKPQPAQVIMPVTAKDTAPKVPSGLPQQIAEVELRIRELEAIERRIQSTSQLTRLRDQSQRREVLPDRVVAEMTARAVLEVAEAIARDSKRQAEAFKAYREVATRYPNTLSGERAKVLAEQLKSELNL